MCAANFSFGLLIGNFLRSSVTCLYCLFFIIRRFIFEWNVFWSVWKKANAIACLEKWSEKKRNIKKFILADIVFESRHPQSLLVKFISINCWNECIYAFLISGIPIGIIYRKTIKLVDLYENNFLLLTSRGINQL